MQIQVAEVGKERGKFFILAYSYYYKGSPLTPEPLVFFIEVSYQDRI